MTNKLDSLGTFVYPNFYRSTKQSKVTRVTLLLTTNVSRAATLLPELLRSCCCRRCRLKALDAQAWWLEASAGRKWERQLRARAMFVHVFACMRECVFTCVRVHASAHASVNNDTNHSRRPDAGAALYCWRWQPVMPARLQWHGTHASHATLALPP